MPAWQISSHQLLPQADGHEQHATNRCLAPCEKGRWHDVMELDAAAAGCIRAVEVNNLEEEDTDTGMVEAQQELAGTDKVRRVGSA